MAVINITGLYLLLPKVKALLADYHKRLASGEIKKTK
ncbi:MAG: alanine:cation symporter family protein [bacterium]|nr:alanine:cation symporter family protein [bacterium]